MKQATIFNIQRYSLHDGGGIRTLVFFKGCPFTCPWCANPEGLSSKPEVIYHDSLCIDCVPKVDGVCVMDPKDCPTNALEVVGQSMTIPEIMSEVLKDRVFYETSQGGVTLSGGEFLVWQDFAMDLLAELKKENIHTAIETTMAMDLRDVDRMVEVVDTFLVDLKILDKTLSSLLLNIDIDKVKDNIKLLQSKGSEVIIRTPLIPNYTTQKSNLDEIIDFMKTNQLETIHLLPFHKLGESKYEGLNKTYDLHELETLEDDIIEAINHSFIESGLNTVVKGA